MKELHSRQDLAASFLVCKSFFKIFYRIWSFVSDTFWDNLNSQALHGRRDDRGREANIRRASIATPIHQRTFQPSSPAYTRVRRRPRAVQANATAGPSTVQANATAGPSTVQANTTVATAGPSTQPGNGVPGPGELVMSPTRQETDLLIRLANGSGLSQYDTLGLMEMCTHCGNYFLGSFLGSHLISCTHNWWIRSLMYFLVWTIW